MIWRHTARPAVTHTAMVALIAVGAAMSVLRAGAADTVRFADDDALHEDQTVDVTVRVDDRIAGDVDGHTVTVTLDSSDGSFGDEVHSVVEVGEGGSVTGFIEVHPRRIGGQKRGLPVWSMDKVDDMGDAMLLAA